MPKKLITIFAAVVVIICGAAVYISSSRSNDMSSNTTMLKDAVETNRVEISNFSYSPSVIRVKVGTKVTWTNKDTVQHSVVGDKLADLSGPLLSTDKTYSFTFDKVGTYGYHCAPHPHMKGTVFVTK
ncbi:TPA: hypothetical protein DIV49_00505 [Candidatus Saccharibacteria bacterium]|mgnify:FL=1|nr:hypothetical protein [Candidatus Saccharibacteria bacterium]HRJ90926.1 plastocyanin/azurin family copper-binding protein [Candidatus Saccharibacteria bacterium]